MSISGPVAGGPVELFEVETAVAEQWKVAVHLAKGPLASSEFRDNNDAVFSVILAARELGIGPCAALVALAIDDEGRLTLSPAAVELLGIDGSSEIEVHREFCRLLLPSRLGGRDQ